MYKIIISLILVVAFVFGCCSVPSSAAVLVDDIAIVGVVTSLVLLCGFSFADYQSAGSFASDLWSSILSAGDRYQTLIDSIKSLVSDTYDSLHDTVTISGDLLGDFVDAVEEINDITIYPILSSPSVTVQNRFYLPVMYPFVYNSSVYYQLSQPVSLSSLPNGLNLLYGSDLGSSVNYYGLYLYKENNSYQLIGKLGNMHLRLTALNSFSSASSFGLLLRFENSSFNGVYFNNYISSGWANSYDSAGGIRLVGTFFDSDGSFVGSLYDTNYIRYNADPATIVGSSNTGNWSVSESGFTSAFTFRYFSNYVHSISFGSTTFQFPFKKSSTLSMTDFTSTAQPFLLLCLSLAMGLDKGIGTYDLTSVDVPIYQNPSVADSDDNIIGVLLPLPDISIKYPKSLNSPDLTIPSAVSDLVVSDIPDNPPADPDDPDDPLFPVIPDIDTGGILHYITDFFESIADFFSFLFDLIGSFPTSLTFPIYGGFLLLVMIGIIIICL